MCVKITHTQSLTQSILPQFGKEFFFSQDEWAFSTLRRSKRKCSCRNHGNVVMTCAIGGQSIFFEENNHLLFRGCILHFKSCACVIFTFNLQQVKAGDNGVLSETTGCFTPSLLLQIDISLLLVMLSKI